MPSKNDQLYSAAEQNNIESVTHWLNQGADMRVARRMDIRTKNDYEYRYGPEYSHRFEGNPFFGNYDYTVCYNFHAIHWAIHYKNQEMVRLLVQAFPDCLSLTQPSPLSVVKALNIAGLADKMVRWSQESIQKRRLDRLFINVDSTKTESAEDREKLVEFKRQYRMSRGFLSNPWSKMNENLDMFTQFREVTQYAGNFPSSKTAEILNRMGAPLPVAKAEEVQVGPIPSAPVEAPRKLV
jgi:hypothetical protein